MGFSNWLIFFLLLLGLGIVLLPLAVIFLTSITPPNTTISDAISQQNFTLANYQEAWQRGDFLLAFANSTLVAIGVTTLQILTSALAGYALARLKFRGREAIILLVLATLIIPFQLLVIPVFLILKWGHLINTYWSLILPTAANGFGIFLMR
jgi:multiple sugar transport system permease protein